MASDEELLGHSTRASCVEPRLATDVCTDLPFALHSIFFPVIFSHQDTLLHTALLISTLLLLPCASHNPDTSNSHRHDYSPNKSAVCCAPRTFTNFVAGLSSTICQNAYQENKIQVQHPRKYASQYQATNPHSTRFHKLE